MRLALDVVLAGQNEFNQFAKPRPLVNGIEVRPLAACDHRHAVPRLEILEEREGALNQDIATGQHFAVQAVPGGAKLVDLFLSDASLPGQRRQAPRPSTSRNCRYCSMVNSAPARASMSLVARK